MADVIVAAARTATESFSVGALPMELEGPIRKMVEALQAAVISNGNRKIGITAAKQVAIAASAIVKQVKPFVASI